MKHLEYSWLWHAVTYCWYIKLLINLLSVLAENPNLKYSDQSPILLEFWCCDHLVTGLFSSTSTRTPMKSPLLAWGWKMGAEAGSNLSGVGLKCSPPFAGSHPHSFSLPFIVSSSSCFPLPLSITATCPFHFPRHQPNVTLHLPPVLSLKHTYTHTQTHFLSTSYGCLHFCPLFPDSSLQLSVFPITSARALLSSHCSRLTRTQGVGECATCEYASHNHHLLPQQHW